MDFSNQIKYLLNKFFNRQEPNNRKMKRVFQWRRYLEWKELTLEEKLSAKRFLLIPVFVYLIIRVLNQNLFLILLLIICYMLYKKFESGGIEKK